MGVLGRHKHRRLGRRGRFYALVLAPLNIRERLLLSGALIVLAAVVLLPQVRASSSGVGQYILAPFSQCDSDGDWFALTQATGQPDANLTTNPDLARSARWSGGDGSIICGAAASGEDIITNPAVQLHLLQSDLNSAAASPLIEGGNTGKLVVDKPVRVINLSSVDGPQLDTVAEVEWSTDKGKSWSKLTSLSGSDLTGQPVTIPLPALAQSKSGSLALRLTIKNSGSVQPIWLDSAGLLYQLGAKGELLVDLNSETPNSVAVLSAGKTARAQIILEGASSNIVDGVMANLPGQNNPPTVEFKAELIAASGERHPLTTESTWKGTGLGGERRWDLSYGQPRSLDPGAYTLSTQLTTNEGQTVENNQPVLWGVVALNTAKSSYQPDEPIDFLMTVLDARGATVCDASLVLTISLDNNTVLTLSTADGSLSVTDTCLLYGQQIDPDYTGRASLGQTGVYDIGLRVQTADADFLVADSVTVADRSQFITTRTGPTRIFPVNPYDMAFKIEFNQDFNGLIKEAVPAAFSLIPIPGERPYTATPLGDETVLSWQVSARSGDSLTFRYRFDAPDISPEFYVLGPLKLSEDDQLVFAESRAWQLAGDAVGRMLLLWDGGSAPSGWSCVSCSPGDDFYQRFIRGEATYGSTGGAASHGHTAGGSIDATTDPMPARSNNPTPNELSNNTHGHSFSPTIGTASNLPNYRQLRVIRNNTAGQPASLPAGAIALFDASVPSGWTQYSAQDGYYIRGENGVGTTGGSNSHSHAITGTTGAASGGERRRATASTQAAVATDTHTHDAAGTSPSTNNEPPYIETILGQLDSDSAPPDNMIAMWDDEPPTEWVIRSDSGASFYQRFIKADSAFGDTGGADSHSPSDTAYASAGPSATTTSRAGGTVDASDGAHTHTVNVTGLSTDNHLPPYINVIIAKKQPSSTLGQTGYRWFANQDSADVGSPLAAADTATAGPRQGTAFRLRLLVHVSDADRAINGSGLKLQFAARSGSCDTSFIGETYADVSDSAGDIRYYDNSTPADGDALTDNANDPTHSGHTINNQSYDEANNFTNNQSAIPISEDGLWDLALVDFSAAPSSGYCFRVIRATGDLLDSYLVIPEITTDDGVGHMLLLWDGGSAPSGWSCISCNPGDDFYQRFIRGEATYGSIGGAVSHGHTADGSIDTSTQSGRGAVGTGLVRGHDHSLTPTITAANNLPVYRQLKVIRADDSGTPGTIPSGAIAFFDASVPGGWTQYSAQDDSYIRGENTAGSTGGSNSHTHTVTGTTSPPTNGIIRAPNTSGTQDTAATDDHTHTVSGNSQSANNEPSFIQTILGKINSDGSSPTNMLAMWDADPPGAWSVESASGDPFYQRFIKPAASYGTTGGAASHNHASGNITTSAPSATANTQTGGTNVTPGNHTHTATISNFSTDSHLPPYINTILAKLTGTNTAPDDPASLDQIKVSTSSSISVGGWADDVQVSFSASLSDADDPDSLAICVEVQPLGSGFTDVETGCGSPVSYSGSPVTGNLTLFGLTNTEEYHWQARVKDSFGAYSGWVSFGANPESARDFAIDDTDPAGTVYDGSTVSVDIDLNSGSLTSLSANWSFTDGDSGIDGYEYSLGTSPGATDLIGWTDVGTTTSTTDSSLSLRTTQAYFYNVRATDLAGNQIIASSDGQLVAPTLSFSTSPGSVNFDNLNSLNGYSDTEDAVLTSSTNAYGGYEIRSYATATPTSPGGDFINGFNGGTYASPDEWLGGDTGYGYTSNDSLIQGANKFGSAPCAGGGDPPCWAPFALAPPGDIVADHTDNVVGTAIVNENFIITHRVMVTASQAAGTYQTELIYSITARY